MGREFQFCNMKRFFKLDVVVAAQRANVLSATETVHLMVCR